MRIRELDGLRGIAVIAVVNRHYLGWLPITGSGYGWLGVDLFFVLSGFLITSILMKLRKEKGYFSIFYKRRALRIFPPYYLAIGIYLAFSIAANKPGTIILWAQYIFYYTSLFVGQPVQLDYEVIFPVKLGLAVLWSLSVEEIYYIVWAPVVRYISTTGLVIILTAAIVCAPLLRWWLHTPQYPETYTFYCRVDAIAIGSMVAILTDYRKGHEAAWKHIEGLLRLPAMAMVAFTVALWIRLHGDRASLLLSTLGISMADLIFGLIVLLVVRGAGSAAWWIRGLRARWLCSIGMVSYSLYLFHEPIGSIVHGYVAGWPLSRHSAAILQTILSVIASLIVAYVLWYAMEYHILKWKDRNVPGYSHL